MTIIRADVVIGGGRAPHKVAKSHIPAIKREKLHEKASFAHPGFSKAGSHQSINGHHDAPAERHHGVVVARVAHRGCGWFPPLLDVLSGFAMVGMILSVISTRVIL